MASPAGKDGKDGIVKAAGVAVAAGVALGILGFVKGSSSSKSKDRVTTTSSDVDHSFYDDQEGSTTTSSSVVMDDDAAAAGVDIPVAASLPPNGHLIAGYSDLSATDLHQSGLGNKDHLYVKEFEEIRSSVTEEPGAGDGDQHHLINNGSFKYHDQISPEKTYEQLIKEKDVDHPEKKPWYMSIFGDHSKHSNSGSSSAKYNAKESMKSSDSKRFDSKDSIKSHSSNSFSAGANGFYEIKKGDTLWAISGKHGVSVASLMAANGLHGDRIYPGETLVIPQA